MRVIFTTTLIGIFLLVIENSFGQHSLYISKQTGESNSFTGTSGKTTDEYESGNVSIIKNGPIQYDVLPNDFSIGPNQTKTWTGTVRGEVASAPAPGNSANANLIANYTVTFSRPAGTGTGGTVISSYSCLDSGGTEGCEFHGTEGGMHEIIQKTGNEQEDFVVYSIKVHIPDTICIGLIPGTTTASGNVNAIPFPASGGSFQWTSFSSFLTISDPSAQNPTITLSDTSKKGTVEVKFAIEGVTYRKSAYIKYCECQCKPITNQTFGPLTVTFTANPTNTTPDATGLCEYSSNNASFTLQFKDNKVGDYSVGIQNASISFKKDCKTGNNKSATITWEGELDLGEIKYIGAKVTKVNITIDDNGQMTGTIDLNAHLTQDKDLFHGIYLLRKGITGSFKFDFAAGQNFNGSFNFLGVSNINVDIVKTNTIIAQFKNGTLQADGSLDGTLSVVGGAKYQSNLFTVTMGTLSLDFSMSMDNGFKLKNGSGSITVSNMKGINGTATVGLTFNNGNCAASLSVSNMQAFTMTFNNISLTVNFNSDFDMIEFDGKLDAKHNSFDVAIKVNQFTIKNGELTKFSASGKVKYSAFTFELLNSTYDAVATKLSLSAKVELAVTGNMKLQVDQFTIDGAGTITVGKIAGSFNKAPLAVNFNATFQANAFKGGFSATFTNFGLSGQVDIGAQPSFNYGYLAITANTNVPLGNSGLKLTQVGGQGGLNYQLQPSPGPSQGTYVLGLTLGVADIADMCEVTGNPVIQLGNGSYILTLNGTIKVLKNNAFFTGTMNVNYRLPQNTIDGSVGTVINVPSNGFVFKSNNLNVSFNIGNNAWSASGANMGGTMFNVIALSNGYININGSLSSPTQLTGNLGGKAAASFNQSVGASFAGISFSGTIDVNMNSNINASINQNGLNGSFGVNVTGSGTLNYSTWVNSGSITVSGSSNADIGYNNGTLSLYGNMTINLPFSICIPWYDCYSSFSTGINIAI